MAGNEDFFEENDKLFCKFCCKVIDHTRQRSVDRHKENVTHIQNKKNPKLQKTLQAAFTTGTTARMDNVTVIESWIRASVSANLPFWTIMIAKHLKRTERFCKNITK